MRPNRRHELDCVVVKPAEKEIGDRGVQPSAPAVVFRISHDPDDAARQLQHFGAHCTVRQQRAAYRGRHRQEHVEIVPVNGRLMSPYERARLIEAKIRASVSNTEFAQSVCRRGGVVAGGRRGTAVAPPGHGLTQIAASVRFEPGRFAIPLGAGRSTSVCPARVRFGWTECNLRGSKFGNRVWRDLRVEWCFARIAGREHTRSESRWALPQNQGDHEECRPEYDTSKLSEGIR